VPRALTSLPGWVKLAAVAAVVLAGAAGIVAATRAAGRADQGPPRLLLPDLSQRSPYNLDGATVGTGAGRRYRLGFASAVDNVGAGPLLIDAARPSRRVRPMSASQRIQVSDGSTRVRRRVGRLLYTRSRGHQHWHYLGFDRYSIRSLGGGKRIRRDAKTGFCLGDRYESDPLVRLTGEPRDAVLTEECGRNSPGLIRVREGISVGYGDDYDPQLEGQYLDITGLPGGRYELVHEVNADRSLRESSYANNAASIVLDLSWPAELRGNPRIEVVRRCGDGRRCTSNE
jgi:hypothetical protein